MAKASKKRSKNQAGCMWGLVNMLSFRRSQTIKKFITNKKTRRHPLSKNYRCYLRANEVVAKVCNCVIRVPRCFLFVPSGTEQEQKKSEEQSHIKSAEDLHVMEVGKLEEVNSEINNIDEKFSQNKNNVLDSGEGKWKNSRRTIRGRWKSCEICEEIPNISTSSEFDPFHLKNMSKMSAKSFDFDERMEDFSSLVQLRDGDGKSKQGTGDEFREVVKTKSLLFEEQLTSNTKISASRNSHSRKNSTESEDPLKSKGVREESGGPRSAKVTEYSKRHKADDNLCNNVTVKEDSNSCEEGMSSDDVSVDKNSKYHRRKTRTTEKKPRTSILGFSRSEKMVGLEPGLTAMPRNGADIMFYSSPESIVARSNVPRERDIPYRLFTQLTRKLIKKSPTKDQFLTEKIFKPKDSRKRETIKQLLSDREGSMPVETAEYRKKKLNSIYVEAKKHLTEYIGQENESKGCSEQISNNSLGIILSSHEEISSSVDISDRNFTQVGESLLPLVQKYDDTGDRVLPQRPSSFYSDKLQTDVACQFETTIINAANINDNANSLPNSTPEESDTHLGRKDELTNSCCCSVKDMELKESEVPSDEEDESISEALEAHRFDSPDSCLCCTPERPSPVSVLEIALLEEDLIPSCSNSSPEELRLLPQRLEFGETDRSASECPRDESTSEFVISALKSSTIDWDKFFLRPYYSDQLLDPSIVDKYVSDNEQFWNRKLLLACANEVLLEICNRHICRLPGLSVTKPCIQPLPDKETIITKAWNLIQWHLLPVPPPRTLDQLAEKDLSRSGEWMDLQEYSNSSIAEVSEMIFDDLIEEVTTILLK